MPRLQEDSVGPETGSPLVPEDGTLRVFNGTSGGDRPDAISPNGEGRLVEIDPNAPWAGWPRPEVVPTRAHKMRFVVDDVHMPAGGERLVLEDEHGMVGYPTSGGMTDLSTRIGFPWDFVQKLPLNLQADILNTRVRAAKDLAFTMTRQPMMGPGPNNTLIPREEGYRIVTNISPGWRSILPHADVAQAAFNIMRSVYNDGISIAKSTMTDHGMEVRLQTDYTMEVSPGGRSIGDVLGLGVRVWHRYGMELGASLYIQRLVCLNGMTTTKDQFQWKTNVGAEPQRQLEWLYMGIANAVAAFDGVVEKARLMAATPVHGDLERALLERARAMRIHQTHHEGLLEAWRQEPGPTEWHMQNAFTRFATHDPGLNERQREAFQATAGSWTENYDFVNARLPRPIAEAVGASIYADDDPIFANQ